MSDQKDGYKLVPDADSDQEESVDDVEDGSSGSSQHLQNYPSAAQSSLKGTAVGASESVRIEWKKLTPQEQRVQVLAGRALRRLNERAKLLITVENDSVYGAALALPQVARTAGWSLEYTSLACHSMMFLLTNLLLQGFLLYMLSKELRTLDKFGGQMHLCDFGCPARTPESVQRARTASDLAVRLTHLSVFTIGSFGRPEFSFGTPSRLCSQTGQRTSRRWWIPENMALRATTSE